MKALLFLSLIAALTLAQGTDAFELRGIVFEIGPNMPLAGAQVTVYQFNRDRERTVFASIVTDSTGAFQFKPTDPGDYYVEATRPDYFAAGQPAAVDGTPPSETGALVHLNSGHPSEEIRLALVRFGELKGKVVDEDGKPVSGLVAELIPQKSSLAPALSAAAPASVRGSRIAADGSFGAAGLVPGGYIVRLSTGIANMKHSETNFSEADQDAVDQDFATSYWPSVPDRASASIATVNPGGTLDLGTVHTHKEARYRIHLVVHGCEPGDQLQLQAPGGDDLQTQLNLLDFPGALPGLRAESLPCKDLLVAGFRPGSYRFIATTQHGAAVTPFTITDRNATVTLNLVPNGDVVGRVVMASGDPPPPRQPALQSLQTGMRIVPDAKGNFTITGVKCLPGELLPGQLDGRYYIKELRVDGVAASPGNLTLCAGSRLEIVLDDKMATLAVSVTDAGQPSNDPVIFLQRWPESMLDRNPQPTPAKSGSARISQLAPGDYRILAVREVTLADGEQFATVVRQLWDRATKITLAAGDAKSISVPLIDPFE
jgi:hypothetical protein